MKYELLGGQLPVVSCTLEKGESIITESGGMCWMDDCFNMNTSTNGGVLKGLARSFSGESLFLTDYTCENESGTIAFGSSFPGRILPIEFDGTKTIIAQKTAFLASEKSVNLQTHFRKKLGAGFFGGEGFILQKLSGTGTAFLEIDGDLIEKELKPGEVLKVDQGYIACFEETVNFDITSIKGLKNKFLSGEGFFIATLSGPGKVWLQTMPFSVLADRVISLVPKG